MTRVPPTGWCAVRWRGPTAHATSRPRQMF